MWTSAWRLHISEQQRHEHTQFRKTKPEHEYEDKNNQTQGNQIRHHEHVQYSGTCVNMQFHTGAKCKLY